MLIECNRGAIDVPFKFLIAQLQSMFAAASATAKAEPRFQAQTIVAINSAAIGKFHIVKIVCQLEYQARRFTKLV